MATELEIDAFNVNAYISTDYDRNVNPNPLSVNIPQMQSDGEIIQKPVKNLAWIIEKMKETPSFLTRVYIKARNATDVADVLFKYSTDKISSLIRSHHDGNLYFYNYDKNGSLKTTFRLDMLGAGYINSKKVLTESLPSILTRAYIKARNATDVADVLFKYSTDKISSLIRSHHDGNLYFYNYDKNGSLKTTFRLDMLGAGYINSKKVLTESLIAPPGDHTVKANEIVLANNKSPYPTIKLPANPATGDKVTIRAKNNNLFLAYIDGNGKKIEDSTAKKYVRYRESYTFIYYGQWYIIAESNG